MNRRAFLRNLAVAPIAVPMVVTAASSSAGVPRPDMIQAQAWGRDLEIALDARGADQAMARRMEQALLEIKQALPKNIRRVIQEQKRREPA